MNECVGGLWIKKSKAGREYFSIQVEGKNYVAFLNEYRKESKHPHYRIFVSEEKYQPTQDNEVPF